MRRTLALAERGRGKTQTNPLVGAVLTTGRGDEEAVLAEGYHRRFGGPHAEVIAIQNAHRAGQGDLSRCTLYVNLEPCCHYGKTPPCTDLLIAERIGAVVVGMQDPFPKVRGKGIRLLRDAGIRVETGILEDACRDLNRVFVKNLARKMPWVTLKTGQTLDGKIATTSGESRWITGEKSRAFVHRLRSQYDAVCVGAGTVVADNPLLSVRGRKGRQPYRVIVDGRLRSPLTSHVFLDEFRDRTILLTSVRPAHKKIATLFQRGVHVVSMPGPSIDLAAAMRKLYSGWNIATVLVEGGGHLHGECLRHRIVDDAYLFFATRILGSGRDAIQRPVHRLRDAIPLRQTTVRSVGEDWMLYGRL